MKNEQKRRSHINNQFLSKNIKFNYFDAIEPNKVDELSEQLSIPLINTNLTGGEKGCLLSHAALWKKMLDENLDYIAIFEDDIFLAEDANYFLSMSDWIPQNVDILKIEAFADDVMIKLHSKIKINNKRKLYALKERHLGTGGYIIFKQGAKNILDYIRSLQEITPIDNIIFEKYIANHDVYQMFPALCIQDFIYNKENINFLSGLQHEREIRQNKEINNISIKYGILCKVRREILRLFFQLYNLHYKIWKRKIKFR
ncbi:MULTISPECIES: glycosyltransferase family 25 protein [unclassified Acinetobacter]|uniref:glycosyltransferase family 25 protein n=1 Tax=unclassified Acinetobacter TaxID=196816 RepID=UPI0029346DF4|nr:MULTISPECIES: glycosyltransferase family 25 protein [unclassified Acinetobacter]WOE31279.1 glycosyltransferase family 25 protein [Acinetobacter sp. SAAs470]WOE39475.1 glycosyltransferase family 25 protein [Acinetobacter sp. SAAs474]